MRERQKQSEAGRARGRSASGDVHDDLAGALHHVGIVEGALVALAVDAPHARLRDPVMLPPFPTHASPPTFRPLLTVAPRSRRLARGSMRRSFPVTGEKGNEDNKNVLKKLNK